MATADEVETHLKLKVSEAMPKDLGRGLARLDPADMARLGLEVGDVVEVVGKRTTVAKAMPAYKEHRGQSRVQIDGVARENAGAAIDRSVEVRKAAGPPGPEGRPGPHLDRPGRARPGVHRRPARRPAGDGRRPGPGHPVRQPPADFKVDRDHPSRPGRDQPDDRAGDRPGARRQGGRGQGGPDGPRPLSYEDIGGLKRELHRIREIIELPLRYPEVFERLGIEPAQGRPAARAARLRQDPDRPRGGPRDRRQASSRSTARRSSTSSTARARPICGRSSRRPPSRPPASSSSTRSTPSRPSATRWSATSRSGSWRSSWP